jgi:thiosulfate dehydrogenase [quinone] large subunit
MTDTDTDAAVAATGADHTVAMDAEGRIRIPRGGARTAAALRIGLGLMYLWAFVAQGFGVGYTNVKSTVAPPPDSTAPAQETYGWNFSYDASNGWITSGFQHSPSEGFVNNNTHGPLAFIPQNLPTGVDDFGWMFALGGLGIALTFGICSRIAGWGGFALNIMIWFSSFPPSTNPIIDGEHMAFAFSILLLMWLQASNYWGVGRWWRARVPMFLG